MNSKYRFSIIIPAYNEEENIGQLIDEVSNVMQRIDSSYEMIVIDDGSNDGTLKAIITMRENKPHLKIIQFRKNFGQTAAIDAGIKYSSGEIIITIDSDLQNDPEDIPELLNEMNKGFDVVSGWRKNRKDGFVKNIISRFANILRKLIFKDKINDSGCTLKVYRRECFNNIILYGEMHRFIPELLEQKGFKVSEVVVNHRERKFGKSKYNFSRTINGFLDMLLLKFWIKFSTRPIHLLGGMGIALELLGVLLGIYLTIIKLYYNEPIANRPLLILTILLIISGLLLIVFGLLADIIVKIYYKDVESYSIKEKFFN